MPPETWSLVSTIKDMHDRQCHFCSPTRLFDFWAYIIIPSVDEEKAKTSHSSFPEPMWLFYFWLTDQVLFTRHISCKKGCEAPSCNKMLCYWKEIREQLGEELLRTLHSDGLRLNQSTVSWKDLKSQILSLRLTCLAPWLRPTVHLRVSVMHPVTVWSLGALFVAAVEHSTHERGL